MENKTIAAAAVAGLLTGFLGAALDGSVPYPDGYRNWVHVKSVMIGPQSAFFESAGGLHHIYANAKGMEGYRTGKFPDGSVLVYDLLGTKETAGNTLEGPRRLIDVMIKDSTLYAATGGWGFEVFLGDSRTDRGVKGSGKEECFACHEQRKEHDFVFSEFRK
jgi:hypothetical protein